MIYKNLIKFFFGSLLIIFIFWNRIIRVHQPTQFMLVKDDLILFYLYKSSIVTIVFLFLFVITLKKIFVKKKSTGILNSKYFLIVIAWIKTYILETPIFVYEEITQNINLSKVVEYPASLITAHLNYPRIIVIVFYYTPQITVAVIFALEVIFYNQKVIFFKALSLLIIFIIVKSIFFIFKHYSARRLTHYNLFFDIETKDSGINISLKPPHLLPQHILLEQILKEYNTMYLHWLIYKAINIFMLEIENFNEKYNLYVKALVFFLFALGWLYSSLYFFFLLYAKVC